MRLMYWPNERPTAYPVSKQIGPRSAFEHMKREGILSDLEIWSPLMEYGKGMSIDDFENLAVSTVTSFNPDVLFVHHVTGVRLYNRIWRRIKTLLPRMLLVYHETDPFDQIVKRVDSAMRSILECADVVYSVGIGIQAKLLERYTKAPVRYLPHSFALERSPELKSSLGEKKFDIVMIGNRGHRKKLKFLYLPGGRSRAKLAKILSDQHRERFHLYGRGWDRLSSSKGLLDFESQHEIIQSAKVSVNWDHFDDIDFYFSDRLPISLAAGVPHVTTWHFGYDELFSDAPGLYTCKTVSNAVEVTRWLIGRHPDDLISEGLAARKWVCANLEARMVYSKAIADLKTRTLSI